MPPETYFGVYVDGHALAVNDAFVSPGVYNFSADISAFAGSDAALSFTSFNNILFYEGINIGFDLLLLATGS